MRMIGEDRWEWWTGEVSYVFERVYVPARNARKHFWSMPNGQGRDTLKDAVLATVREHNLVTCVCMAFAALGAVTS